LIELERFIRVINLQITSKIARGVNLIRRVKEIVSVLHSVTWHKAMSVTEHSEISAYRGFILEAEEEIGLLPYKRNVGRPGSEHFGGINLVPVKNSVLLKANIASDFVFNWKMENPRPS
jgi:hypothetical protein